jgi:hypothetical protein
LRLIRRDVTLGKHQALLRLNGEVLALQAATFAPSLAKAEAPLPANLHIRLS